MQQAQGKHCMNPSIVEQSISSISSLSSSPTPTPTYRTAVGLQSGAKQGTLPPVTRSSPAIGNSDTSPSPLHATTEPPPSTGTPIDEDKLTRAFEQIVSYIYLDDDDENDGGGLVGENHSAVKGHKHMPDLNLSPSAAIGANETSQITPKSSPPGQGLALRNASSGGGFHSLFLEGPAKLNGKSPSRINRTSPRSDASSYSPAGVMSVKSLLDDDWLEDRIEHDQNMARVAAGLVRPSSTPLQSPLKSYSERSTIGPASLPQQHQHHHHHQHSNSHPHLHHPHHHHSPHPGPALPPGDYICKLCNVPGHWLRDCGYYEPRGSSGGRNAGHSRSSSSATITTTNTISSTASSPTHHHQQQAPPSGHHRSAAPPGNYVCRLCNIPGHWIESCVKFQPKHGGGAGLKGDRPSHPPKNYVCNLCHRPGHWIQQCSEFTPMPTPYHTRHGRFF